MDESTQLCGLSLPAAELLAYLSNDPKVTSLFEVPADRNPPASYILGQIWSQIFGFGVPQMRFMGVTLFALATMLVSLAGALVTWTAYPETVESTTVVNPEGNYRETRALRAAWLSGLMMALSSTAVINAVEIRPYPLFLFLSSASLLLMIVYLQSNRFWILLLLGMSLLAAAYTHFFGIVLAGTVTVGLVMGSFYTGKSLRPVIALCIVFALSLVGLIPFLRAALAVTGNPEPNTWAITEVFRLWGRFAASPPTGVVPGLEYFSVLLFSLLAVAAIARTFTAPTTINLSLVCSIFAGILAVVLASLISKGFNPLAIHYNIWALPFAYVFVGSGIVGFRSHLMGWAVFASMLGWLGTQLFTCLVLACYGNYFAHGTIPQIEAEIQSHPIDDITIIHDGLASLGASGFPLWWRFRDEIPQLVLRDDETLFDFRKRGGHRTIQLPDVKTKYVIVLESYTLTGKDLSQILRGKLPELPTDETAVKMFENNGCKIIARHIYYSFMTNRLVVMSYD